MIPHGHRIVVQGIHRQHHRIEGRVVPLVMKVFEWCPLNRISRVHQQQIGIILARFLYQRGDLGDAHVVILIRVVIDWENAAVHVGRAQDDHVRALYGAGPYRGADRNRQRQNRQR